MWGFDYVGSVPEIIQKRILKFIVKLVVGAYVAPEELEVEDLTFFGSEASLTLSNIQLINLEKINELLLGTAGIAIKKAALEKVIVSIQWKSLLNGKLSVKIDGLDVQLSGLVEEEDLEKSVWFDAMSDSTILEAYQENTSNWLEQVDVEDFKEKVLDLDESEELSSDTVAEEVEEEFKMFKGFLQKLLSNLTVEMLNIRANLFINQSVSLEATFGRAYLQDITEDLRATELASIAAEDKLLLGKRLHFVDVKVDIISDSQKWKLLTINKTFEEEQEKTFVELRLYKDGRAEVFGFVTNITTYLCPKYIDITNQVISTFVFSSPPANDATCKPQNGGKINFGFIKGLIETIDISFSVDPIQENVESIAVVHRLLFINPQIIALPSATNTRSISFSAQKYFLSKVDSEGIFSNLLESDSSITSQSVVVTMDTKGLGIVVQDKLELQLDKDLVVLGKSFKSYLYSKTTNEASNPKVESIPFTISCPRLSLTIPQGLVDLQDSIMLVMDNLLISGNQRKSIALTFQSASLSSATSHIILGTTTISRSKNDNAIIGGKVETEDINPFAKLYTLIEGVRFYSISSVEESRQLEELLETSSTEQMVISSRSIVIQTSAKDLLWLKSFSQKLGLVPSATKKVTKSDKIIKKIICASIRLAVEVEPGLMYELGLADLFLFDAQFTDVLKPFEIIDCRTNLNSFTRGSLVLGRKPLTLHLDGSMKALALTLLKGKRAVLELAGLEFIIPVGMDLKSEITFFKLLLPSGTIPMTRQKDSSLEFYINMCKCSLTPTFPTSWPKCYPSTFYCRSLRVIFGKESKRAYIQDGYLFMSKRLPANPPEDFAVDASIVVSIFEDGMAYWIDKGYAPIGRTSFLSMDLAEIYNQDGHKYLQLLIENEEVTIEVCEDSVLIAKSYFEYISNISRYSAFGSAQAISSVVPLVEPNPTAIADIDDMMFTVDQSTPKLELKAAENNHEERMANLIIEENFFKASEFSEEYRLCEETAGFSCFIEGNNEWEALLEVPLPSEKNDETLVLSNSQDSSGLVFGSAASPQDVLHVDPEKAQEGLEIDEEYFSKPVQFKDSFPFSRRKFGGVFRFKLVDFTVKIRLVDGLHFPQTLLLKSRRDSIKNGISPLFSSPSDLQYPSIPPNLSVFGTSPSSVRSFNTSAKWTALTRTTGIKSSLPTDSIEIVLDKINCEADWTRTEGSNPSVMTDMRSIIRGIEVRDGVKKSSWKTILTRRIEEDGLEETPLENDGNDWGKMNCMVRCELSTVLTGGPEQMIRPEDQLEYRLKLRILPIRIHLDQNALKFAAKFIPTTNEDIECTDQVQVEPLFFQHCDIAEISIRLDYKPSSIDFRRIALGKYAELLNFFQLEGAELTLPAVRLRGVKGADHFAAELLRSWLPFIRSNNQISKMMINGISPVRTVVRLGSGFSDLVLLPMQHYKKDGRVIRGLRKGTASFLHSTTLESARIGSKLASGTRVILEQLDDVFEQRTEEVYENGADNFGTIDQPPEDLREGLMAAYQSLSTNITQAMQTIIAVPVQVYERSGPGGAMKAVIRAVPVAILKPMIGTAEAVNKTFQGIENTLDTSRGVEIRQKYKKYPPHPNL